MSAARQMNAYGINSMRRNLGWPLLVVGVLSGCSESIQGSIDRCNDDAAKAIINLVPNTQIAKEHIRDQEQGAFFRCMKSAGYKPSEVHSDEMAELVRKAYPGAESKVFFERLNEITRQTMRDPKSGYWKK